MKLSRLSCCIKIGLIATSSLVSTHLIAETYDLDFSIQGLNTFGNASLNGSGDLDLFSFSRAFNLGDTKNLKIPFTGPNLGTYGFKASGFASAEAGLRYDYNLGQHSYNLNLPISIDLNVSEIDAQNRITVSSSYSLGANAGISPLVDSSDAFFKIDPHFAFSAGVNSTACFSSCFNLINESIEMGIGGDPDNYLIDVSAQDLNVYIDESTGNTQVGAQLSKYSDLLGIQYEESLHSGIGKAARKAGLDSLITHIPGDEFEISGERAAESDRTNSFNLYATGRDEFLEFGTDMINLAANLKPGVGGKVAKVLHSNFETNIAGVDVQAAWDLLDIDMTATAFMQQNFSFNATPTIDLKLSNNKTFTMEAGQELVIQLDHNTDFIDLTPTFNLDGNFRSTIDLGFGLGTELETLGYSFKLPIGDIDLVLGYDVSDLGIGNINMSRDPIVLEKDVEVDVQIASTRRNINQFTSVEGETLSTALPSVNTQGTAGKDILEGSHGPDTLFGLGGNDIFIGSAGDDILDGGAGIDTVNYKEHGDGVSVNLGLGTEGLLVVRDRLINIENVTGSEHDDIILGDEKNNVLDGAGGNDSLYGMAGNDTLIGGIGNDTLDGGEGIDMVSYRYYQSQTGNLGVTVDLELGLSKTATPEKDTDTLINIENVRGSIHNDKIYGNEGNNELRGDNGSDLLNGRGGDDKLYGGQGHDFLHGGDGDDLLDGRSDADSMYGGSGNDTFIQSASHFSGDYIEGGEGIDTLDYQGMQATYYYWTTTVRVTSPIFPGGPSKTETKTLEHISESPPVDPNQEYSVHQYDIGIVADLISGKGRLNYGSSEIVATDLKHFSDTFTNKVGIFFDVENINGTQFNDILYGDNSDNVLDGREGDDQLYGRNGNDTFIFSNGNDLYDGGSGTDTIDASGFEQGINLNLTHSNTVNIENVIGTQFDDTLVGDDKHNRLDGGAGNNTLLGGSGNDVFVVHNDHSEADATNSINGGSGFDSVLLTHQVKENEFVASYQNGDLILNLNSGYKLVLDQQYMVAANKTEQIENAGQGIKNISGTFEALVSRGEFLQYEIASALSTEQNISNQTTLISRAKLTNNHTLTNNGQIRSHGALENNGKLVNRGTLIVSSMFDNNSELHNETNGVIQFLASNRLNGTIKNNGLISVSAGNWLQIGGEYFGSGHFAGNVAFDNLALNIGNSPGDTSIQGDASFADVDFNLEVGVDPYGNIIYDTFNVLGDFTLAGGLNIGVSLLDGLSFEDLFGIDFNFINVSGDVFNGLGERLTIDDLLAYTYEVADNVFARWNYFDDFGYSLSFSGTDLFVANDGVLPSNPSEVPAPKTLSILLFCLFIALYRKTKISNSSTYERSTHLRDWY